jgi:hypothetical protein
MIHLLCSLVCQPRIRSGVTLALPIVLLALIPAYANNAIPSLVQPTFSVTSLDDKQPSRFSTPSVADEICRPLLRSSVMPLPPTASPAPSSSPRDDLSATDGPLYNRIKPAEQAAAQASTLSLALGVRFALGPMEDTAVGSHAHRVMAAHVNLLEPGSENLKKRSVYGVYSYRECMKRESLRMASNH